MGLIDLKSDLAVGAGINLSPTSGRHETSPTVIDVVNYFSGITGQ